ncbi:MAG: thioredoxin family protein [Saprospiraceae bacterium]|nr:thioredoxin family protein [Saprospiraceae bacterium]
MKNNIIRFFFIITAFCFSSLLSAQGEGIQFFKGTWEEALALAKTNNKLIFMDAYTTWCGPCKMMSKNIFPDKEVGEYYNKNFINLKMDMEKGEGKMLAAKFTVKAYPTLLFIDPSGEVVHKFTGYQPIEEFIELGKAANDPSKRMSTLDLKYKEGDRSPDFLYEYAHMRLNAFDGSHIPIAEEYIKTQTDLNTPQNIQFIFDMLSTTKTTLFDYFIKNRETFEKQLGTQDVANRVEALVMSSVQQEGKAVSLDEVDALFKKVYPKDSDRLSLSFRMSYFLKQDNIDEYAKYAIKYFKKYQDSPEDLNEAAWMFYEEIDKKSYLKKAVKWAKKSIALNDAYYNNDTLASLYFKLKNKSKAKEAALKAIEMGKKSGDDVTATQELLKEIDALQ